MGRLESLISAMPKKADEAQVMSSILDNMAKSIGFQKAVDDLAAVIDALPNHADTFKELHEDAFKDLHQQIKDIPQYSDDAVQALIREQIASQDLLRKQISSIKIPTPDKVDLSALLEAVANLKTLVANIRPPAEIPEQKTYWTFDIVRNRTTGLIEKVEAR